MIILYLLACACLAMAFVTAVLRNKKSEKWRFITKLIASVLFCVIAFLAVVRREAPMNYRTTLMLTALVLGFVGDVLLGLDAFVQENCQSFLFLVGGLPFFIGHILYIVLLLS
ncbi:MAG: lysoplasmalogenase family protein, partial [Oscillospiraceae bacterium]|nr:lysoplasmalogenase family protein [Oscillospiraceae bacterium]